MGGWLRRRPAAVEAVEDVPLPEGDDMAFWLGDAPPAWLSADEDAWPPGALVDLTAVAAWLGMETSVVK
jgi:hypothetical protein